MQYYLDENTNELLTESEIKARHPETSFPVPFGEIWQYKLVFNTPQPVTTELQVAYIEGTEIDSKDNLVTKWSVKDKFNEYTNDEGFLVTKAEQEAEYMAKKVQDTAKAMENAIESHIYETVKTKGYNGQDSIAKYLVDGNPFYDECKAISIWIGNVWIKSHEIQRDVEAGTRPIPTINEVIAELPVLA